MHLRLQFCLQHFDENGNDILDGQETVNVYGEIEKLITSKVSKAGSAGVLSVLKRVWNYSDMDGDNNTGTKTEIGLFFLRFKSL